MSKVGGFGQHDISFKNRINTWNYYTGVIDSIDFGDDVSISYREDGIYPLDSEKKK